MWGFFILRLFIFRKWDLVVLCEADRRSVLKSNPRTDYHEGLYVVGSDCICIWYSIDLYSFQTVNTQELLTTFFPIIKGQLPFDALAWNSSCRMNRSVSFSDFVSFDKHFASTSSEEKLQGIFKLFDNNNEGILRRHEVRKFAVVKLLFFIKL